MPILQSVALDKRLNLKGNDIMKDSTALILSSVAFNLLTLLAVISSLPVSACAVLSLSGAALLGAGFYNLAKYN